MNKRQLREEVAEICADNDGGEYEGDLVKGSVQLIQAYYNPNF
jgi:hypothetical protein